jgi:hypothetical protein
MPFTPTINPPSINPFLTVEFAGLMLLSPGPGNTCNIGIHHWSLIHTFQVMLIVNKPGHPPTLVRLLTGPLTGQLAITLDPQPAQGDFQVFAPTTPPFIRQSSGNDARDYRFAINLRDLHPSADYNDGARPIATLSTGVLYTSNLSPDDLDPKFVRGTLPPIRLYYISADLAAAIQPPTNTNVKLTWSELGEPQSLILPRRRDPAGTTYTVSLINEPPISSPPEHDELGLYYKVLTVNGAPIPSLEHWRLEYAYDEKTDEIPCMSVTLEP